MRNRGMFLIVMAATLMLGAAWAGPVGPVGLEFQVNTYTTDDQRLPSIAMDTSGNFAVVWMSEAQDGDEFGVYGQHYDTAGVAQGGEFLVNTYTTSGQVQPSVGMDGLGNFVIVWTSAGQDGDGTGVYGQRYDALGVAQGGEFLVNSYTTGDQSAPSLAMDLLGNFVVVWTSSGQDGSGPGVYGQRYNASGVALGSEFQVNTYTMLDQWYPSVAMDTSGNFVVVWESLWQDGDSEGVYGQRYDALGVAQGTEFQVNTYTTLSQLAPSVAMDDSGNFVVVWYGFGQDGVSFDVYGQRYDASGMAQGTEFRVNTYITGYQAKPSVAMDGSGNFIVVWEGDGQDGEPLDIYGKCYDASGEAQGAEFRVNTYIMDDQAEPWVAMDGGNNFVVVWISRDQDGDLFGVYGQRYALTPTVTTIATTASNPTEGGTLTFNVTFSEDVTGVDVSDFALSITGDIPDAVIVSVTGSGSDYTVLVGDVAGDGTLRLDLIDDDSIINGGGIPLGGVGAGNGDFTTGVVCQVVPQLPIATWPAALALLILGAMGSLFYTKKQTVKK